MSEKDSTIINELAEHIVKLGEVERAKLLGFATGLAYQLKQDVDNGKQEGKR